MMPCLRRCLCTVGCYMVDWDVLALALAARNHHGMPLFLWLGQGYHTPCRIPAVCMVCNRLKFLQNVSQTQYVTAC
jgi:hypothetical protein